MKIVAEFDFNNGKRIVENSFSSQLSELRLAINNIDANLYKSKVSNERTMMGQLLYSPVGLNEAFKNQLNPLGWNSHKEYCNYQEFGTYLPGYIPSTNRGTRPFRDMDFIKDQLGVEVQFGKYAFMVYNVCAKMTIFKNLGLITAGVEIVPVKNLANQMSTGVSYFEQFAWDLSKRGVSNIDTPVLILGIDV